MPDQAVQAKACAVVTKQAMACGMGKPLMCYVNERNELNVVFAHGLLNADLDVLAAAAGRHNRLRYYEVKPDGLCLRIVFYIDWRTGE